MRSINLGPGVDDRHNLGSREIGQSQIVRGGKGEDVAFAYDGFGAEEEGFVFYIFPLSKFLVGNNWRSLTIALRRVLGLLLLNCAIVIDKDKSVLIRRIGIALRARVSGAQIAGRVVRGQGGFGREFLLSSDLFVRSNQ